MAPVDTLKHMKLIRLLIVAIFLSLIPGSSSASGWQFMSSDRVYDMLKEGSGLWLIDVRGASAFEEGHVEGAVNIPVTLLKVKRFPKQKVLVFVDDSLGLRRAKEAAAILVRNGQERVYVLDGGMVAWEQERFPIVGNSSVVRKVLVRDLRWAQESKIKFKLFDLRSKEDIEAGIIPGSKAVKGKDLSDKVVGLKKALEQGRGEGIAGKLKGAESVILIMPASINIGAVFEESLMGLFEDVRYLEGGYAAWAAKRSTKTSGSCPVCSGKD